MRIGITKQDTKKKKKKEARGQVQGALLRVFRRGVGAIGLLLYSLNGLQLPSMDLHAEFTIGMELPAMLVLLQYILVTL